MQLDTKLFTTFVEHPRNYSLVVVLTATGASHACEVCQYVACTTAGESAPQLFSVQLTPSICTRARAFQDVCARVRRCGQLMARRRRAEPALPGCARVQ